MLLNLIFLIFTFEPEKSNASLLIFLKFTLDIFPFEKSISTASEPTLLNFIFFNLNFDLKILIESSEDIFEKITLSNSTFDL